MWSIDPAVAAAVSASKNTKSRSIEVTVDAPSEPVKLGDKIKATVKAKYYFGSPVS